MERLDFITQSVDHRNAPLDSDMASYNTDGTSSTSNAFSSSASQVPYAVGTAPEHFYSSTLAPWRASARRFFIRRLRSESEWIASLQDRVRSPWLDTFFVYTSSLDTHTFFMMALPALFFFGLPGIGRG